MMNSSEELKALYQDRKTRLDVLVERRGELEKELSSIDIELLEKSQIVLNRLSERQRRDACKKIEDLCTFSLQYAISPDLEAKIEMIKSRGKPAAKFLVVNKKTGVESEPMFGNGGGIVDTTATALRYIAAEVWTNPIIDGPMFLDEAYKHLSKEYTHQVATFLKNVTDDFGRQTIMSTHNEVIAETADRKIAVSLDERGRSKVEVM